MRGGQPSFAPDLEANLLSRKLIMSKNRRILVIDDNQSVHTDFRKILCPVNREPTQLQSTEAALFGEEIDRSPTCTFEVDCASQGQEGCAMALDAAKAGRPYALAFVDMRMPPGWDGIQTIEHIWAEYPDLQMVICTAYSDYSWENITKQLGHSDQLLILKKPFDTIEVMQLALALTEKWNLTHRVRAHIGEVERKVAEQTRDLQEFAYGVSHDLQEPLRKVMTFGDRLLEKCGAQLDQAGKDYLNRMQDASRRMSTLIQDVLALSRVTTRANPLVPVDLNIIVSGVLSDLEVLVEKVQGKVEVSTLPTIEADSTQMRQLFQNLIGNALKFRRKDVPPVLRIEAEQVRQAATFDDDDRALVQWRIKVQDNGIGFDEKYREKIFEVFHRLHSRTEYEGSGIGLSLCRKIVGRHNGSISGDSVLGQGSTFLITLPEKQPAKSDTDSPPRPHLSATHTETSAAGATPTTASAPKSNEPLVSAKPV
jgi:signal transduction histidine kinase